MASRVLKNAFVSVAGTDLSNMVRSVSITPSKDSPEDTAMGDDSRSFLAEGLRNASLSIEFNHDDAAGAVSATMWTEYTGTAVSAIILRPDAGVVSATNPQYTFNAIVTDYDPISGSVGDVGTNSASLQVTGDITRATS